jgi:DNA ligase-1
MKIKSIKKLDTSFDKYDLEIENNHNFFANEILVHNCRCIATSKGLFSRKGEPIISVPHISEELQSFFDEYPDAVLDGELYNHELKNDFNKICSLVKKKKPTEQDLVESKEHIQYWIYDAITKNPLSYEDRMNIVPDFFDKVSVRYLPYIVVYSTEHIDSCLEEFLNNGYEGAMIRTNAPYENKRSKNLLKYKLKDSDEFILVDILEGKGNWAGYAKKAMLRKDDGTTFEASIAGSQLLCRAWLTYKEYYIDKPTTVEYHGLTPDGIPRFGVIKEFSREM